MADDDLQIAPLHVDCPEVGTTFVDSLVTDGGFQHIVDVTLGVQVWGADPEPDIHTTVRLRMPSAFARELGNILIAQADRAEAEAEEEPAQCD